MINNELVAAKRVVEIIQEREQELNVLNISAALNKTSREFSERNIIDGNFKRNIE